MVTPTSHDASPALAATSVPGEPAPPPMAPRDERLMKASLLTRLMRRPELGGVTGLILVTVFFALTADPSMFTLAGILTILDPGGPARHPGGRRGAADDRRRVRSVDRLDDRLRRADLRAAAGIYGLAAAGSRSLFALPFAMALGALNG